LNCVVVVVADCATPAIRQAELAEGRLHREPDILTPCHVTALVAHDGVRLPLDLLGESLLCPLVLVGAEVARAVLNA